MPMLASWLTSGSLLAGLSRNSLIHLILLFRSFYIRYAMPDANVGHMAHVGGFIGGLFLGIICLKNLKVYKWERVLWYVATVIVSILILAAVLFNIFYKGYPDQEMSPLTRYVTTMKDRYNRIYCFSVAGSDMTTVRPASTNSTGWTRVVRGVKLFCPFFYSGVYVWCGM